MPITGIREDILRFMVGPDDIVTEKAGLIERLSSFQHMAFKELHELMKGVIALRKRELDELTRKWHAVSQAEKDVKTAVQIYDAVRIFNEKWLKTETLAFALGHKATDYAQRMFSEPKRGPLYKGFIKTFQSVYPRAKPASLLNYFVLKDIAYTGKYKWLAGNFKLLGSRPVSLERRHVYNLTYMSRDIPPKRDWEFTGGEFQIELLVELVVRITAKSKKGPVISVVEPLRITGGKLVYGSEDVMKRWGEFTTDRWN